MLPEEKKINNCWDFWSCAGDTRKECPAHKYDMGKECWMVASNFDGKDCPKVKGKGMMFCIKNCEWFKKCATFA